MRVPWKAPPVAFLLWALSGCGGVVVFEESAEDTAGLSRVEKACGDVCEKRLMHPGCYPTVEACRADCVAYYEESVPSECGATWIAYQECAGQRPEPFTSCNESGGCFEEYNRYQECLFEASK